VAPSVLTDGPILFDSAIYPDVCLNLAIEAYRELLQVDRLSRESNGQMVRLTPLSRSDSDPLSLRREFLNYVLDLAVQHALSTQ
jgi:hypothetical protein